MRMTDLIQKYGWVIFIVRLDFYLIYFLAECFKMHANKIVRQLKLEIH